MTDFDKQRAEILSSLKKTNEEMEKQQEMFLASWKRTSEEMEKQQLKMAASWKEMSMDAERQFAEMMKECKISSNYKNSGLDFCAKECIVQQLIMLRNYYAMVDKDLRKRYRNIQGKKEHSCELRELVRAVKTIDKLYYQVNDMIKELQSTEKFQRKLGSKKNNK